MTALVLAAALSVAPMDAGMRGYFAQETIESYAFMGFGAGALGTGIPLFVLHDPIGRPMSIPIIALGLVELVLGVGLWLRTPAQVDRLSEQLEQDPAGYKEAESTRMRGVMAGFQAYRLFELTVLTTGAVMAGLGYVREQPMALGVGLGMALQAAVLLFLDFFAEARGRTYQALLADFAP